MEIIRESKKLERYYVKLVVLNDKQREPLNFNDIPKEILDQVAKDLKEGYNPATSNYGVVGNKED